MDGTQNKSKSAMPAAPRSSLPGVGECMSRSLPIVLTVALLLAVAAPSMALDGISVFRLDDGSTRVMIIEDDMPGAETPDVVVRVANGIF